MKIKIKGVVDFLKNSEKVGKLEKWKSWKVEKLESGKKTKKTKPKKPKTQKKTEACQLFNQQICVQKMFQSFKNLSI